MRQRRVRGSGNWKGCDWQEFGIDVDVVVAAVCSDELNGQDGYL